MGADLTLRTGIAGDVDTVLVDWIDETGDHRTILLEIVMLERDRPRTIEIRIESVTIYRNEAGRSFLPDTQAIPRDGR